MHQTFSISTPPPPPLIPSPEPPPSPPESSQTPMESTIKIIRKSIHTFLQHYTHFTTIAFLALPFSTTILLSTTLLPDSLSIQSRLHSLFDAAGFPRESEFFSILSLKLSQTVSTSLLVLPFTLTSLLFTKSFIIKSFNKTHKFAEIYNSILQTQLWNTLLIVSANATCFWILFIGFNCLENLRIPSLFITFSSGITYSIVIANATIICNLALILSGMESKGGFISILKSCAMIRGRASTALSVSLPVNIGLAGIEGLFQFRVVKAYLDSGKNEPSSSMVLEGLFIAYLYSILIVLDVVMGCVFFRSCNIDYNLEKSIVDQEASWINEIEDDERNGFALVKCLEKELF